MNVEIGAEAALFPEKEYINGIAVAVIPELIQIQMPGAVWYWNQGTPSGTGMVQYRTEIPAAGMPMPETLVSMSMPSYGSNMNNAYQLSSER